MSQEEVPASDLPQQPQDQEVPQSDLPDMAGQEVPADDLPQKAQAQPDKDYGTIAQQVLTGIEGMARPLGGDVAMKYARELAEKYSDNPDALVPSMQDVQARERENPVAAGIGEVIGNVASMKGLSSVLPQWEALGTKGSRALNSAISMAMLQGGEEMSKHTTMPDPTESASDALAHMGYSALLGGATDGLFSLGEIGVNKGFKALENSKLINRANSFLAGYGAAAEGMDRPIYDPFLKQYRTEGGKDLIKSSFDAGHKFHSVMPDQTSQFLIDKAAEGAGIAIGAKAGAAAGAMTGGAGALAGYHAAKKYAEPILEKILDKPVSWASRKLIVPTVNKVLTSGTVKALPGAVDYAIQSAKGAKKLQAGLNMLFQSGAHEAFDSSINPRDRQKISDGIDDNILDQQIQNQQQQQNQPATPGFAAGGQVMADQEDHFGKAFPQENMVMQAARSRVYNHLKQLKPVARSNGLAFDQKDPTGYQKRTYEKALDLATNPLSILGHIKKGTISSEHVSHMYQMWPELTEHLNKKITERITQAQLSGEKPSYKIRQGLSMLMRTPLESTMTPFSIQSAQSVFVPKAPNTPAQGQGKLQRGTSKLGGKTNKMYNTQTDAAENDRISRD
jgi:hypothetical protein